MYRAKDAGRDRHELFNDEIRLQEIERHETERTLRNALDDDRLRLLYQPIVDLHTGRPIGAEALLRIADPDQGMLRPRSLPRLGRGQPASSSTSGPGCSTRCARQLAPLGRRRASSHLGAWVNVSGQELASPRFVALVQRALEAHRIDPGRLHLECTENALLEATPGTLDHLRSLSESGRRHRHRRLRHRVLVARRTCGSCPSASSRSTAPSPAASTSPVAPRWSRRSSAWAAPSGSRSSPRASSPGARWRRSSAWAAASPRATCSPGRHRPTRSPSTATRRSIPGHDPDPTHQTP